MLIGYKGDLATELKTALAFGYYSISHLINAFYLDTLESHPKGFIEA